MIGEYIEYFEPPHLDQIHFEVFARSRHDKKATWNRVQSCRTIDMVNTVVRQQVLRYGERSLEFRVLENRTTLRDDLSVLAECNPAPRWIVFTDLPDINGEVMHHVAWSQKIPERGWLYVSHYDQDKKYLADAEASKLNEQNIPPTYYFSSAVVGQTVDSISKEK